MMRCDLCGGTGRVEATVLLSVNLFRVSTPECPALMTVDCPECGGSGIVHCCGGEQAQPGAAADRS
jgi:hypothetical protein